MSIKSVYLAGHMLSKGSQMQRAWEREQLEKIGVPLYNPMDNKSINDKQANKHSNDDLAERIVAADVDAIWNSDVCVIEPLPEALGTINELGMIYAFNWWHEQLSNIVDDVELRESAVTDSIKQLLKEYPHKKVLPHVQDVRRHDAPEVGDRRSWGMNAFVYGVCLALTDGKGLYEYDEIWSELEKLKGE